MPTTIYYHTSSSQSVIVALQQQYCTILGLPNDMGTLIWDTPTQSVDRTIWFIQRIAAEGWGNDEMFSYANVMAQLNLTNIIDMPYDSAWFPVLSQNG